MDRVKTARERLEAAVSNAEATWQAFDAANKELRAARLDWLVANEMIAAGSAADKEEP